MFPRQQQSPAHEPTFDASGAPVLESRPVSGLTFPAPPRILRDRAFTHANLLDEPAAVATVVERHDSARAVTHAGFVEGPAPLPGDLEAAIRGVEEQHAPTHHPVAPDMPLPEVPMAGAIDARHGAHDMDGAFAELDDDELIALLGLRETAREALRNRLMQAAHPRERRSAYELVFLMLAFAAMVLLTSPPIVRIIEAAQGG